MANDYNNSFTVNKTASEVFEALTQKIDKWWSTDFEGSAANVGDEFTVRFGKTFKTFTIEQLHANEKIVWRCTAQLIDHPDINNQSEWVGTSIIWTLGTSDFSTKVNMLHQGLAPGVECYAVCEKGWDSFIASLFALLEGGDGLPFLKQ